MPIKPQLPDACPCCNVPRDARDPRSGVLGVLYSESPSIPSCVCVEIAGVAGIDPAAYLHDWCTGYREMLERAPGLGVFVKYPDFPYVVHLDCSACGCSSFVDGVTGELCWTMTA